MSHFTVMVIGDNPEDQLAAFHEFECTGQDDEYVQDLDETEQLQAEYDSAHREYYRLPNAEFVSKYDATEEEKEQGTLENLPVAQFITMREFLENEHCVDLEDIIGPKERPDLSGAHKYGYTRMDGDKLLQFIRRTNPHAKWDWYQLGGRWSGMLKLKPEYSEAVGHAAAFKARGKNIPDTLCEKIRNIGRGQTSWMNADEKLSRNEVDTAPKYAIDFDRMVSDHLSKVVPKWDAIQEVINGREWLTWAEMREKHSDNIEAAREEFNKQTVIEDLNANLLKHRFFVDWEGFKLSREEFIVKESLAAVSTFALLKDGEWREKGEMGWFGMSSNEKDEVDWSNELIGIIEQLPDDTQISVYDCHI